MTCNNASYNVIIFKNSKKKIKLNCILLIYIPTTQVIINAFRIVTEKSLE